MLLGTKTRVASPPKKAVGERSLRRLAGAVLLQALEDLGGPAKYREQAQSWMSGQGESAFSFELCCSLLGVHPRYIQDRLAAMRLRNFPKALSETAFGNFLRDS